jgi:threonine dehydrogenase-like Zn-dependent dehydrogenase
VDATPTRTTHARAVPAAPKVARWHGSSALMKALRYYASKPRFLLAGQLGKRYPVGMLPLRLERVEVPPLRPGWSRVQVRLAGICGSDLGLLFGKVSPRLSPFFSYPAILGHEIVGEIDGSRVVVNPLLGCRERGLEACEYCRRGESNLCLNVAEGPLAPGGLLGYCRDVPGGWAQTTLVRGERLFTIPDSVPDERAILTEPLAVVLRGLQLAFSDRGGHRWPSRILVIGAGSIGLLTVLALRLVGFTGELHVVARYPAQADLARAFGASNVHSDARAAAGAVGAKSYRAVIGPPALRGGFSAVIDAAGSASSLDEGSWLTREGGTLLLLGAPGSLRHDFSPHWFHELKFLGSYTYSDTEFGEAVALLSEAEGIERVVTNRYPLEEWRAALGAVQSRQALKAVFDPRSGSKNG